MTTSINGTHPILIAEDDEDDYLLTIEALKEAGVEYIVMAQKKDLKYNPDHGVQFIPVIKNRGRGVFCEYVFDDYPVLWVRVDETGVHLQTENPYQKEERN